MRLLRFLLSLFTIGKFGVNKLETDHRRHDTKTRTVAETSKTIIDSAKLLRAEVTLDLTKQIDFSRDFSIA